MNNMKTSIVLSLLFLLNGISFSQNLTEKLIEIGKRNDLVGMSVCVVKQGDPVLKFHFGAKNLDRGLPIDDSTVYRIASISKMVTVTALMLLYDQGLFKLNDDVNNYLGFKLRNPNFPDVPITFAMLMSHTASLREGKGYDDFLGASYQNDTIPELHTLLCKGETYFTDDMWSNTDGPDKNYFSYANINFGILGTLVERISGERFDKYCIEHIFKPLKLNASFDVRDIDNINNVAVIYRKQDSTWTPQTDNWKGICPVKRNLVNYKIGSNAVIFAPQGGVRISALDLSKFMVLHQNNGIYKGVRILSDSTCKRMHQLIWKTNGSNGDTSNDFFTTYALGCMKTDKLIPGAILTGHSGEAYGLLSDMYYSEKEDWGIVFIMNGGIFKTGSYSGWYKLEEEIFTACYKELVGWGK